MSEPGSRQWSRLFWWVGLGLAVVVAAGLVFLFRVPLALGALRRGLLEEQADWLVRNAGESAVPYLRGGLDDPNRAYAGLKVPVREVAPGRFVPDFGARYLTEDVPFGLAASRAIAALAGVETPAMDRVIAWAGERLGQDYLGRDAGQARIPQKYGLDSLARLIAFANEELEIVD